MAHAALNQPVEIAPPAARFKEALEEAERLLKYAAEIGVEDIDAETRAAILHARAVFRDGWTEDVADKLRVARTRLAYRLKPVTAASLKRKRSPCRGLSCTVGCSVPNLSLESGDKGWGTPILVAPNA